MTAIRRVSAPGLALLLAAATAAADTVITIDEVVGCSVTSADADSVRIRLTRPSRRPRSTRDAYEISHAAGRSRTIPTADIYEIRLSNPSRFTELSTRLPQLRVILDSGQAIPPLAVRVREICLRLDGTGEVRAEGLFWPVDTLARNSSPAEMGTRCRDMGARLRWCRRSDNPIVELLFEVNGEEKALRGVWPGAGTSCLSGALGWVLGVPTGAVIGFAVDPHMRTWYSARGSGEYPSAGLLWGCAAGCVGGPVIGAAIGAAHRRALLAGHRSRINDLVRRVNRAVGTAPP